MTTKVDFMVLGAGRSGTTTIYKYLSLHSEICFSKVKEIHFFSIDDLYKRGESYYHSLFEFDSNHKVTVGADTYLLVDKEAPQKIKTYNSNMKFIIMLRNPVERAYSGYQYAINNGYFVKKISFDEAAKNEKNIIQQGKIQEINNLCNIYQSKYFEHISYWQKFFPKENFLLLKTSELKDIKIVLKKISTFLNINEFPAIESEIKANTASIVKSKRLQQLLLDRDKGIRKFARKVFPQRIKNKIMNSGFIEKIYKLNRTEASYEPLTEEKKEFYSNIFKEDLQKLEIEFEINFEK